MVSDLDGDKNTDIIPIDFGSGYNPYDRTRVKNRGEEVINPSYEKINFGSSIAAECPGDANSDSSVDVLDLLSVIGSFGTNGSEGDVNSDGSIDVLDLLEVIGNFGQTCD